MRKLLIAFFKYMEDGWNYVDATSRAAVLVLYYYSAACRDATITSTQTGGLKGSVGQIESWTVGVGVGGSGSRSGRIPSTSE